MAIAVFGVWMASPEDTQSALHDNLHGGIIGRSQKYFKDKALFRYLIGCIRIWKAWQRQGGYHTLGHGGGACRRDWLTISISCH